MQRQGGKLVMNHLDCTITLPSGGTFSVPFSSNNILNLRPLPHRHSSSSTSFNSLFDFQSLDVAALTTSVADEANQNLTANRKEHLIWHWRLVHVGFG